MHSIRTIRRDMVYCDRVLQQSSMRNGKLLFEGIPPVVENRPLTARFSVKKTPLNPFLLLKQEYFSKRNTRVQFHPKGSEKYCEDSPARKMRNGKKLFYATAPSEENENFTDLYWNTILDSIVDDYA